MKLPKTVCVKVVKDGELSYLQASEDIDGMVDTVGEKMKIGVYKLIETKTVEGIWQTSNVKRVKK
jgi:hypothetical protein